MERGSWAELSNDSNLWKKIAIGGLCLLTVLPIPIALGAILTDLEERLKAEKTEKAEKKERASVAFPSLDDPSTLLGRGLAPSFMFGLMVMVFTFPTIVMFLSYGQLFAMQKSEHSVGIFSLLITTLFGLLAVGLQFVCTSLLPIAIAQYARGLSIKPALDPMANLGYVLEMGASYWTKCIGWWMLFASCGIIFILALPLWVSVPLQLGFSMLGFISLILASRYALHHLESI